MHTYPEHTYVYRARCTRIVDGDTLELVIDAGFHLYYETRVRLLDAWAPEIRGPERVRGQASAAYVAGWTGSSGGGEWPLLIYTVKDDAFGRFLAVVWRNVDKACLNDDLVAAGHATLTKQG